MDSSSPYSKLFTIDEANALLPVVRPIMENILETIGLLRSKSETVIRSERIDPETPNLMRRLQRNPEIAGLIKQINDAVEQVQRHGCVCKGVEQGLLDFPCLFGAEIVFLCWQYGEPEVSYWHRIEDGFAGRRPLLDPEEPGTGGAGSLH